MLFSKFIAWSHLQDFQISMIGSHCKLQVADIYPEDEGKYSCKAVNSLGEISSTCFVTVEGRLALRVVFFPFAKFPKPFCFSFRGDQILKGV